MDSAPRDDTPILGWNGQYIAMIGWGMHRQAWCVAEGYETVCGVTSIFEVIDDDGQDLLFEPIAWQPLPEPPK